MRVELRTTCKNCSSSSSPCQLEIRDSRPTLVVDQKSRDIALEGRTSPVRVSTQGASWKAFILGSIIQGAPRPECRRMNNCGVRPTAFWGSQAKYIHFKPIARTTNSSRLGWALSSLSTVSLITSFHSKGASLSGALHSIQRTSLFNKAPVCPANIILIVKISGRYVEGAPLGPRYASRTVDQMGPVGSLVVSGK